MIAFSKLTKERQFPQIVTLILLILLLVMGTLPGYMSGKWQWQKLPEVSNIKELRKISKKGLIIPGWQIVEQKQAEVGEGKWSRQIIQKDGSEKQAILLLLPQVDVKNHPQIEWTEMNSFWHWDISQFKTVEFPVKPISKSQGSSNSKVTARFFRGVTKQSTFAVLQWYAWSNTGDPSPFNWFVADQRSQLQRKRTAWVAVNLMIPMEPLGKADKYFADAKSLAETVQEQLMLKALGT
jgi:cyanoexosortase B-associated protein